MSVSTACSAWQKPCAAWPPLPWSGTPGLPVVFAGGVMSSEIVRDYITKRMQYAYFVPGKFASDNAIGVSILAAREINAWPNTSM